MSWPGLLPGRPPSPFLTPTSPPATRPRRPLSWSVPSCRTRAWRQLGGVQASTLRACSCAATRAAARSRATEALQGPHEAVRRVAVVEGVVVHARVEPRQAHGDQRVRRRHADDPRVVADPPGTPRGLRNIWAFSCRVTLFFWEGLGRDARPTNPRRQPPPPRLPPLTPTLSPVADAAALSGASKESGHAHFWCN